VEVLRKVVLHSGGAWGAGHAGDEDGCEERSGFWVDGIPWGGDGAEEGLGEGFVGAGGLEEEDAGEQG